MTGKLRLYIGLLVLGLVVIVGGVWMLAKSPPKIDIPEGNPVIYERLDYVMRGQFSYLYFYEDGSILFIEEKGLRPPGGHPTRTWRTGKFTPQQLDSLVAYLENSGLTALASTTTMPDVMTPQLGGLSARLSHTTKEAIVG